MSDINTVVLSGRLVDDPELRETKTGKSVASFRIASNQNFGEDKNTVTFIDVVVWGNFAKIIAEMKKKGDQIIVHGRLGYETWEDKDGNKKSRIFINAQEIIFGRNKKQESQESDESLPIDDEEEK